MIAAKSANYTSGGFRAIGDFAHTDSSTRHQHAYTRKGRHSMDDNKEQRRISRRHFLLGIPAGIAGVVALNAIGSRMVRRKTSQYPQFPKGSIFTPADERTDA
ncbi:MAG: hypothetical protein F4Y44_03585 [Chloroflexi bacterium]|nr:hypothetical protein [Chloroflexota bacterium]